MTKFFSSVFVFFTLVCISIGFAASSVYADSQTWQVNTATSDAWNNATGVSDPYGIYSLAGKGLNGSSNYVGMRFTGVSIPQGATITSAKLTVHSSDYCCDYNYLTPNLYLKIRAQNIDTTSAFDATDTNEPQGKTPTTTAGVDWNLLTPWTAHTWYDSPDISPVVQEVVNRSGWVSGNSMIIVVLDNGTATGNRRHFETYDYNPTYAGKLTVTWDLAPTAPTSPQAYTSNVTFSAIGHDPNTGDTLNKAWVQVDNNADFSSPVWDSNWITISPTTDNQRSPQIAYAGPTLDSTTTYSWRLKFQDASGVAGPWSTDSVSFIKGQPLWDINQDGVVDATDVSIVSAHWHNSLTDGVGDNYDRMLDLDGNGTIDIIDIMKVSAQLGSKEYKRAFESGGGVTFAKYMATDLGTNWGHKFWHRPLDYNPNSPSPISYPATGVYRQIMKLNQPNTAWKDFYQDANVYGYNTSYNPIMINNPDVIDRNSTTICTNQPAATADPNCLRRIVYENPGYTWILGEEQNWYGILDYSGHQIFPTPEVYADWFHDVAKEIKAGWAAASGVPHGKIIGFYFVQNDVGKSSCGRAPNSEHPEYLSQPIPTATFLDAFYARFVAMGSTWTNELDSLIDGVEFNFYPYCSGTLTDGTSATYWESGAGIAKTTAYWNAKRAEMDARPWLANKVMWGSTGKGSRYDAPINSPSDYLSNPLKGQVCEIANRAQNIIKWASDKTNGRQNLDMILWYTTIAQTINQGWKYDSLYKIDPNRLDANGYLAPLQGSLTPVGEAFRDVAYPSSCL